MRIVRAGYAAPGSRLKEEKKRNRPNGYILPGRFLMCLTPTLRLPYAWLTFWQDLPGALTESRY
jgi:hypothetical protein